ncbi:MAG: hypothetical protein LBL92_00805, partial [Propionibacteriaceae bacterium]|nr:hypothetical protein [Propionibacteriaceae bacterium]
MRLDATSETVRPPATLGKKAVAWLSALALTASALMLGQQAVVSSAQAQAPLNNVAAGANWNLTSQWDRPGVNPRESLYVTGDNALGVHRDDEGATMIGQAFVGYWTAGGSADGTIDEEDPTLAAGFRALSGNAADNGTRMSAMDSGDYVGTDDYIGSGSTMYIWPNDSFDFWKTAANHPAEFTDAMVGRDPTWNDLCRPGNWDNRDRGSWVSVVAYPAGSTEGTVFWVPNPRGADVMSAYDAVNNYPGTYTTPRDPSWNCKAGGGINWDDGWGGGEVIQSTGEIFFTSRQSSKLSLTFRTMIFNPATGVFASSGKLQPNDPQDAIFESNDAKVAGDLMVDGNGNGYVIAVGHAPLGSIWHDPSDINALGSQRAYILKITPTPNPNYDPTDPESSRYLHNAGWKYSVVQRIYSDPAAPANSDVYRVFGQLGFDVNTAANNLKGSNWFNGKLYTVNNRYLYEIDPMSGRANTVPATYNDQVQGFTGSTYTADNINPRDLASGQEAMTVSGSVFYDINGDGYRQSGEWGIPGIQIALYEDENEDGIWTLRSDPGMHQTDSSGNYTFFLSNYSTYQIRVVRPSFNPDANPASSNFEQTVHTNAVQAYQSSASYGWGDQAGLGRNQVIAHCFDAPDGLRGNDEGDEITSIGDTNPPAPCAGALQAPYTDPALPPVSANVNDASYTLDNRDGLQVPIYSTVIINSSTRIPNADFGFNTEPFDTSCHPETSELSITPAGPILAGQSYTATVTAKDADGNLCQTATEVTFSANPTDPTFSDTTCTTDTLTGQCSVDVTSEKAGTYDIHAKMPDSDNNNLLTDLGGNGNTSLASPQERTWTPGPICTDGPNASTLTVNPPTVVVGETTVASIHLQDCFGNVIADKTETQMGFGPSDNGFSGFQNQGGGNYVVTVDPPDVLGDHLVVANIDDIDGTPAHLEDTVTVIPTSNCDADQSDFTVSPAGPQEVGGGRQYTLDVTARDASGNVCVGGTVAFDVTTDAAGQAGVSQPTLSALTCTTDDAGHCTTPVTSTSTRAGDFYYHATINGDPIGGNGNASLASPHERTWTFETISCGEGPGSGWAITPASAEAGSTVEGELALYDQYGNPCTGVADKITVGPSTPAGVTDPAGDDTPAVTESPTEPGHYLVDLTANPTVTTDYDVPAVFDADAAGPTPAKTWTDQVTFTVPDCDPATSELAITPAGPIAAGQSYTATVSAKDSLGRVCTVPTQVTFSASPSNGPVFDPGSCTTDGTTGQCSVQVTSQKAGVYDIHAKMPDPDNNNRLTDLGGNGNSAKASPLEREWTFDPYTCGEGPGSGWAINPDSAEAGSTVVGELALYDLYGNPCTGVSDKIAVGPSNPAGVTDPSGDAT